MIDLVPKVEGIEVSMHHERPRLFKEIRESGLVYPVPGILS